MFHFQDLAKYRAEKPHFQDSTKYRAEKSHFQDSAKYRAEKSWNKGLKNIGLSFALPFNILRAVVEISSHKVITSLLIPSVNLNMCIYSYPSCEMIANLQNFEDIMMQLDSSMKTNHKYFLPLHFFMNRRFV